MHTPSTPKLRVLPWAVVALTVVTVGVLMLGPCGGNEQVMGSPTSQSSTTAVTTTSTTSTTTSLPPALARAVRHAGVPLNAGWPKSLTLITDSVGLGARQALPAALPGWKVDVRGRPAVMMKVISAELRAQRQPVGAVTVIAVGYNSLWGRDRANFDAWSKKFDREADELVATVRKLGAKKVVWVTLREPIDAVIPPDALAAANKYRWYFGYVNERLTALAQRDPALALADWSAVSSTTPGLTYDAIHLRPVGARLYSETVKAAAGIPLSAVSGR
ncbi:MAG: hypothetical protein ACKOYM_03675 [Actinomycetes bacterium]